jgi:hypothetical protein
MPLFRTIVQEPLLKASRIPICIWQSSSLPSPEPEPCITFCCYVQGTTANLKNNLLFEKFNINYNNLPQIFHKGSIVYRKQVREYCQDKGLSSFVIFQKQKFGEEAWSI